MKTNQLYDVLAVNIKTGAVRILEKDSEGDDADAVVKMAVMRRGVEEEFFAAVNAGSHRTGDKYDNSHNKKDEPVDPTATIRRIGNTWYPIGPRGL